MSNDQPQGRSDVEILLDLPEATHLYVAGRPVQTSAAVFHRLLLDHGGEALERVFCLPKDEGLEVWAAQQVDPARLCALVQCDDATREVGREKLEALLATFENMLERLWARTDDGYQHSALTVQAGLRVPSADCVFFDGSELRIVQWGRTDLAGPASGKLDLRGISESLKPPPVVETLVEEHQREEREAPVTRRLASRLQVLLMGRRAADRRRDAGALSGRLTVTLMWATPDDLDLAVHFPNGERIYFGAREVGPGRLDTDANAGSVTSPTPIENVFFSTLPAKGRYRVTVTNYASRQEGNPGSRFDLSLSTPNGVGHASGHIREGAGLREVAWFDVAADGTVTSNLDLYAETENVQETD